MSHPKPSRAWVQYYESNKNNLIPIPWQASPELSAVEREAIAASVQEFQIGESSEGRHLFRLAQAYAAETGDLAYVDAVVLFIKEEQRHARDLGQFMEREGIPKIGRSGPDTVFRWLRHLSGLELSITVLLTAEIIAQVYYAALSRATGSSALRTLCEQILRDEEKHVEFQAERLALLRRGKSSLYKASAALLHRLLFAGTCWVVWLKHGLALRAGGHSPLSFWRHGWAAFERSARTTQRALAALKEGGDPSLSRQQTDRTWSESRRRAGRRRKRVEG